MNGKPRLVRDFKLNALIKRRYIRMYVKVQRVDRRKEVRLVLAAIVAPQIENIAKH